MTIEEVKEFINKNMALKVVLSDKLSGEYNKIILRPIELKGKQIYQIERYTKTQVFHANLPYFEAVNSLNIEAFKQILLETAGKTYVFSIAKNGYKMKAHNNDLTSKIEAHNKVKNYLINEGEDIPIMRELGIFTKENKIATSMYDKFKQINRFVEIIDDEFKASNLKEITILDFGSGKSYLTFLIYHYFVNIKKAKVNIIGYDIKKDVVENCNNLVKKYNLTGINFVVSDVSKDKLYEGKIDMVVSLHACDTATDYALNFAIKNKAKYIFPFRVASMK